MSMARTAGAAELPLSAALAQMTKGHQVTQALYAATKLGIADLLMAGPRRVEDLARASGSHTPSLYRLLRALAGLGVFAQDDDGRFRLTPLAELLRVDAPDSMRASILNLGGVGYRLWGDLLYSVQTGGNAFEHIFGMPSWQYFAQHSEEAALFDAFMAGRARQRRAALLAAYDFSGAGTVVDVGGGRGTLLAGILAENPTVRGVLFDRPQVVEAAPATLQDAGVAERCQIVGGDFFESVPPGGDLYVLSTVIHDWPDERATEILQNCRRALGPGGRLLIIDRVIPPGDQASAGKFMDLQMMLEHVGGQERTEAEWRDLLAASGFRPARIIPMPDGNHPPNLDDLSVLEAVPA
jgi:SAM-dependent methyltransferase